MTGSAAIAFVFVWPLLFLLVPWGRLVRRWEDRQERRRQERTAELLREWVERHVEDPRRRGWTISGLTINDEWISVLGELRTASILAEYGMSQRTPEGILGAPITTTAERLSANDLVNARRAIYEGGP